MRKKPWKPILALVVVILGLSVVLLVSRQPWLSENPTYAFLNNLLKPSVGIASLTADQKTNALPIALTGSQRYYRDLVPENAVNILFIGPDVSGAN